MKFRPRYAESVAKQWGKNVISTVLTFATVGALGWGGLWGIRFWQTSAELRVKRVVFNGDLPSELKNSFPVKPNDHLLMIHPAKLEQDALMRFPELDDVSVRRGLDRSVVVTGTYRIPVAKTQAHGKEMRLDVNAVMFAPGPETAAVDLPWVEAAGIDDRKTLLTYLFAWKKDVPEFYSLVKKIETDRMRIMKVELSDGVLITWGELDDADLIVRAKKILKLRAMFHPVKTPATLMFVTTDRIVMDANWKKSAGI